VSGKPLIPVVDAGGKINIQGYHLPFWPRDPLLRPPPSDLLSTLSSLPPIFSQSLPCLLVAALDADKSEGQDRGQGTKSVRHTWLSSWGLESHSGPMSTLD
jgi:hypothetical protein